MIVILKRLDVEQHATFRLFELSHYVFSWQVSNNGVLYTKGVREPSNRSNLGAVEVWWASVRTVTPSALERWENVLANTMPLASRILQLFPQGAWYPKRLQLVALMLRDILRYRCICSPVAAP